MKNAIALTVIIFTTAFNAFSQCGLQANISVTPMSCSGKSDAIIHSSPTGGAGGYTFKWLTSASTDPSIGGLGPGTYCSTVTDMNSCSTDTCVTLDDPQTMLVTIIAHASCGSDCNGYVLQTQIGGGVPPYSYYWGSSCSGSIPSVPTPMYLCPGCTVWVTVHDHNACSNSDTVTIGQVPGDTIVLTSGNNYINMTVIGGLPPFTYLWSNGATTQNITGLTNGEYYSVKVTDANGCVASDTAEAGSNSVSNISYLDSFDIYPNPNNGNFLLQFTSRGKNKEIELFNSLCQRVYRTTYLGNSDKVEMSPDELPEGMYFLNVRDVNGVQVKKFIISR